MKINVEEMKEMHVAVGHQCSQKYEHEAFAAVDGEFHQGGSFSVTCENCGETFSLGIHVTEQTAVEEATGRGKRFNTEQALAERRGEEA